MIKYFVASTTARTAADLSSVHHNTAMRFFYKLRAKIAHKQNERNEQFYGKIKLDESYFGGRKKAKETEVLVVKLQFLAF